MLNQKAGVLFENIQRRGARISINASAINTTIEPDVSQCSKRPDQGLAFGQYGAGIGPLSHFKREGNQQNDITHHGGVKWVVTHTTV